MKSDVAKQLIILGKRIREYREESDTTQEELGIKAGLDRTYIGGVERGERNISIINLCKIADALSVEIHELLDKKTGVREKSRSVNKEYFKELGEHKSGLTTELIRRGLEHTYSILDSIDEKLTMGSTQRLSQTVELANLSSIIGNLFGGGIANHSNGIFERNGPHKYPDLLSKVPEAEDIEIKISLEKNKPKGHLAKAGHYLTARYILGNVEGKYTTGKENRGDVVWIWEIRLGYLKEEHFNLSSTPGDSGKTAVINREGMDRLDVVFCDKDKCPYKIGSSGYREYQEYFKML